METISTAKRIHPLMAAAAVSVIIVSAAGAAAITGILPSSHGETAAQSAPMPPAALAATPAPAAAPVAAQMAAPATAAYVEPAPAVKEEAPARHATHKAVHHHYNDVARNDDRDYAQRPAPQPAAQHQPNYVGIGAGALIGGIIGHQVGGGNGKKLATVAGAIGGGFLGNEIANRTSK